MLIAGGTAVLTGVILYTVSDAVVQYATQTIVDPAAPEKKPKRRSILQRARDGMKNRWEEIKKHPILEAATLIAPPVAGIYHSVAIAQDVIREIMKKDGYARTPEEDGLLKVLTGIMTQTRWLVIGSMLLAAGWSLWLSLHPEVIVAAMEAAASTGAAALDAIGEIFSNVTPDSLDVSLVG